MNYEEKCSYCGRLLIIERHSDVIDGQLIDWDASYCPSIPDIEENENIPDEFARLEMAKHDGA